jgi:YVTN family beta-propeller protein
MSYETPMKTTISLILFSLLTMTFLISTVFSSEIGTANAQKYSVIATIPVGKSPFGVAINPTNGLVYVANANSNTVSVIDPKTNTVVATKYVFGGRAPYGVAINPTNGLVYVTNVRSNTLSVIDPATNKVVATIPVGEGPSGVAINPSNGLVYVANADSNTLSVVSTVS